MSATLSPWITAPLFGAVIGYVTNAIAVRMIFRPIQPVNVLGLRIQGLMPRRQNDLAESIGRVVGGHLIEHKDVVASLGKLDFAALLGSVLHDAFAPKVASLRAMPFVGGFLTDERVADLERSILDGLMLHREAILAKLETALESGLDVQRIVADKVASFPMQKLEQLVLEVARRELRAIEWLGGVLGALIGLGQLVFS